MKRGALIVAALVPLVGLTLLAAPAGAVPIGTENPRPVPVAGGNLQAILDAAVGPGILDARAGQSLAGYWGAVSPSLTLNAFLLTESAGYNEVFNSFGIWSDANGDTDGEDRTMVHIFTGLATAPSAATLDWLANPGALTITGGPGVNAGVYSGIDPHAFGFYVNSHNGTSWTMDPLNYQGGPQALAFREPGDDHRWLLAFEDLPLGLGGDGEYDSMVVRVDAIEPVPEPATLLLLGAGLAGAGAARWRRRTPRP